jgi:hypothetical protein
MSTHPAREQALAARQIDQENAIQPDPPAKIRWAPRLRPQLLKRLYEADAQGIRDLELCDEVGMILYMRCHTYLLVHRGEVACPVCHNVFKVRGLADWRDQSATHCPNEDCAWFTTRATYRQSVHNHYASPGRALDAYRAFYERYPHARTYRAKILLIDQLIHQFHVDEKTGQAVKSVASRLFEGNKKAVVRFLDQLSAQDPDAKQAWRRTMADTIDRHIVPGETPSEAQ